jgi:hypothetical protein
VPLGVNLATLWQGSPEFFHLMRRQPDAINWIWGSVLNPQQNGGMNVLTVDGDREITARALRSIRAEPGVYLWYCVQKVGYFWIGHPADRSEWPFDPGGLLHYYATEWQVVQAIGWRLLMVLGGLAALWELRVRLRDLAPLLGICVYLTVMHAILLPLARHSEPLYPILAVLMAAALSLRFSETQPAAAGPRR